MLFSRLKDLTRFKAKVKNPIDIDALQNQIGSGLFGLMEKSFAERQQDKNNSAASKEEVAAIIEAYAKRNQLMAMASSVVPGPLGVLGSIPELMNNFGNQMSMIYDLGCAYDKEQFINKDVLLDIPFAAFGGNTNLKELQSAATDLQDAPIDALKNKSGDLAKIVIEKTLKKSIVQFVPVAGPILMGTWSKMTTQKIARASQNFLDQNASYEEHHKPEETEAITKQLQIQKIKALANLIECNDEINEAQIAFIGPIIENADIPQEMKNLLLEESIKTGSNFELDYQLIKDYEEDEALIFELVIMAKRSGSIDQLEAAYIFKVANALGLEKKMVEGLLAEE